MTETRTARETPIEPVREVMREMEFCRLCLKQICLVEPQMCFLFTCLCTA